MRIVTTTLAVLIFLVGSSAFAGGESHCWGVDIAKYQGTGTWREYHGETGKLELVLVIENRSNEENFWLTVNYGVVNEVVNSRHDDGKRQFYISRMLDDDSGRIPLYGIDGRPVGSARSLSDQTAYFINEDLNGGIRVFRKKHEGTGEILSGDLLVDEDRGVFINWDDVKLSFVKSILNGC